MTLVFVAPVATYARIWWGAYTLVGAILLWGAWAYALTHRRPRLALLAVLGVVASLWATVLHPPAVPARLGVQPKDMGGCSLVIGIIAGRPADGVLRVGDCITALGGQALDAKAPSADMVARLRDPRRVPAGPTSITVTRGGMTQQLTVKLGAATRNLQLAGSDLPWLLLNSLGVMALIAAILAANGQSARHIGLDRSILGRELLLGIPALFGAYASHIVVSVPIGIAITVLKMGGNQAAQRVGAVQGLVSGVSFWQLVPTLVIMALFEEVVFRGFLLPRVRWMTGHWWLAVVLVQVLFGLGHSYEGTIGMLQTTMLGVYFSVVFLWRRHLGSVVVAHAAFNSVMLIVLFFLQRSGFLEKLPLH